MLNTPDNPLTASQAHKLSRATGAWASGGSATRYYSAPCKKCGGVVRYLYGGSCVSCATAHRTEVITKPCPKCGAPLTAPRSTHSALASPASGQKYCEHCRPDRLEVHQPDAPCFMYVAELDGRHGPITGFGIAADPEQRWAQHRKNLRDEGMHVVGNVWISQQMTRAEALDVESMLKAFSDPCPVPGFKTESLRGHHAAGLISFIQS